MLPHILAFITQREDFVSDPRNVFISSNADYLFSCFLYYAVDNVKCIIQAGYFYRVAKHLKTVLELDLVALFDLSIIQSFDVKFLAVCPLFNFEPHPEVHIMRLWSQNSFGSIVLGKLRALVVQFLHL